MSSDGSNVQSITTAVITLDCTGNFLMFGRVVFEAYEWTDTETDIQTSQYLAPNRNLISTRFRSVLWKF